MVFNIATSRLKLIPYKWVYLSHILEIRFRISSLSAFIRKTPFTTISKLKLYIKYSCNVAKYIELIYCMLPRLKQLYLPSSTNAVAEEEGVEVNAVDVEYLEPETAGKFVAFLWLKMAFRLLAMMAYMRQESS